MNIIQHGEGIGNFKRCKAVEPYPFAWISYFTINEDIDIDFCDRVNTKVIKILKEKFPTAEIRETFHYEVFIQFKNEADEAFFMMHPDIEI